MPHETQAAVNWGLQQTYVDGFGNTNSITKDDAPMLVDKVREYFNTNDVAYESFSYDDLIPYLPE